MADEFSKASSEPGTSPKRQVELPATRAVARARLHRAFGLIVPDMSAAAARAEADIRDGLASRGAQIGFLDDVVDFVNDLVDVTEELLNHFAEDTPNTPDLTVLGGDFTLGLAAEPGGGGPFSGADDPKGASAKQILEARQAILETSELYRKGFQAMAQILSVQLAVMKRPK